MINMLQCWKGTVEIGGTQYDSIEAAIRAGIEFKDSWHVKLLPPVKKSRTEDGRQAVGQVTDVQEYRITVKPYMTRPTEAGSTFDFMEKFNHNVPMPLRTMTGTVEKETRGMLYMHLHGEGLQEIHCMRCGRKLTHPVSMRYGIGPECMSKLGFVCDIEDVDGIKEKLQTVTWEGWVIKSAILEQEEL